MKPEFDQGLRPVRVRPRWWYRAAYILAGLGVGWLVLSGRLFSYVRAFRQPLEHTPGANDTEPFITALIWLLAIGPLFWLAYDLGSQHVQARRLDTSIWRGLRETWRVAWQQWHPQEMAADFSVAPDDDLSAALFQGVAIGAMPLALFLGTIPSLRTGPGIVWIGGASILFGVTGYCRRRAAAYLRDDPGSWSMFRQWSLLNTERYEPAGRPFVRAQIVCMILLPIWWLGGGTMVFLR
jgi:hypothetical protein